MPRGEPLSPELVMVAPPDEARRARAALEQEARLEEAMRASDERVEQVRRAWERLGEHRVEQVEEAWEQAAVRAAQQVERHREDIAVRAAELAQREWPEVEDVAETTEADVEPDERPVWEQLDEQGDSAETQDVPVEEAAAEDVAEEEPAEDWDAFLQRARTVPVEPLAIEQVPEVSPPRKRRRRRSAFVALVVLALAGVVAVGWSRDWFRDSQPRLSSPSAPPVQTPSQPTTPPPAPTTPKATPKKKTQEPRAGKPTRTTAPRKVSKAPKKSAPFVPARVWSWPAVRGSSRYRVRFFRNGRKVLDVRTTKPRLVLAKGFTFQNGRYRWTVVPISSNGARLRPIVDSTFVVSGR